LLSLTKKSGYGLMALAYLAEKGGPVCCARDIAKQADVPVALLMNVMKNLCAHGYIESVRGAHGGYRLAREPRKIVLGKLIDDLERPIRGSACLHGRVGDGEICNRVDFCEFADPVHRLHRKLKDFLQQVTLADIMGAARSAAATGAANPPQAKEHADVR
jgi:Rrf2 family protein